MYSSSRMPIREGDAVSRQSSASFYEGNGHDYHNEDTAFRTPKRSTYTPRHFDIMNTPPQRVMLPPRPVVSNEESEEELYDEEDASISGVSFAHTPSRRTQHKSPYNQQYNSALATTPQRYQRQRQPFQQQFHQSQTIASSSPYREHHFHEQQLSQSKAMTPQRTHQRPAYTNHYSKTPYRSAAPTTTMTSQLQTPIRRPRLPATEAVAPVRKENTLKQYDAPNTVNESNEKEVAHFPVTYNPTQEAIKAYLRIRPKSVDKLGMHLMPTDATNSTDISTEEQTVADNDDNNNNDEQSKENDKVNEDATTSLGPYLKVLSQHEILMTPTEDSNAFRNRNSAQPERYKFTEIFNDTVSQYAFFTKTTLPLIHDVLEKGENALLFAYGVTNSGKTFTIMGTREEPGILPRTLGVIFNSIADSLTSDETKLKPCMHSGVRSYTHSEEEHRDVIMMHQWQEEQTACGLSFTTDKENNPLGLDAAFSLDEQQQKLVVPIDTGYEYSIWVSFAEIYTEKIYDLLVTPPPDETFTSHNSRKRKNPSGNNSNNNKRKALALKYETNSKNKYIAGLKQVRVKSIEEAYAVLFQGLSNRAQYSTLVNQTSSRSHSIFTIAIVKIPIDDTDKNFVIEDPMYSTVSKFQIVDLAGSERYRNTLNQGQRLREAGQINKSLMVLGQCMETLRLNQLKAAAGKKQDMVPFRHSKLTELFRSSFDGNGKAVMVVNVNPYQTGFDENSHVMKFAAVAKDVATWKRVHPKLNLKGLTQQPHLKKRQRRRPPPSDAAHSAATIVQTQQQQQQQHHIYHGIDDLMADEDEENEERDLEKVNVNNLLHSDLKQKGQSDAASETQQLFSLDDRHHDEGVDSQTLSGDEIDEEGNALENTDESEDDEGDVEKDPFVDTLIEELEKMRTKWLEAEARCERMESEIREQVTKETESELKTMEDIYMKALKQDNELNEIRIKQRLDLSAQGTVAEDKRGKQDSLISEVGKVQNKNTNHDYNRIKELEHKQEAISNQLNQFMTYVSEHERTRHQLLEKITELEKSKQKQMETIQKLNTKVKEQDIMLEALKGDKDAASQQSGSSSGNAKEDSTEKHYTYMKLMELQKKKKKVERSIKDSQ